MSVRSTGYTVTEDVLLCQVFLDISQDPIIGRNQSRDAFWSRVEDKYNELRDQHFEMRTSRSIRSRMEIISNEVRKLNACLRQVENLNPSGASDEDILVQAKMLFMQEPKYKKGFKFDHVWNMVKIFEKFKDDVPTARQVGRRQSQSVNFDSSQSDNPTLESPISTSPGLTSFTPSERPIGVKKAKLKRKNNDHESSVVDSIETSNNRLIDRLDKASLDRQEAFDIEREKIAMKKDRDEWKIIMKDLNSIADPNVREYVRAQQIKIIQKRNQQEQGSASNFGNYFNDIGHSGPDLPDY
ncbi:glutathione S-transferase T3-like [Asparagus officinalis]|uniref:glutathione S-transferase T3-like n=1 Tax=Asparagus officinalis TaxID=4686 RepID=UPI00098E2C35|nr:glutathione S-transferase T3-like [Asparagus officinalis]